MARITRNSLSTYDRIITAIFERRYKPGVVEFDFSRSEFDAEAAELGLNRPRNLGDVPYTYRYRRDLPEAIRKTAPEGKHWIIRPAGRGNYKFVLVNELVVLPSPNLAKTKIPDATPGIVKRYALGDEQALLAVVRYNRLIDIFTGLTCYSLQNHLRTTVAGLGQVETDELYIGIDKRGAQYIIPVQAKGGTDRIGQVQIEQDLAVCTEKFPALICRPIAAQFLNDSIHPGQAIYSLALFEFRDTEEEGIRIVAEKHYQLVEPDKLSDTDLADYRTRPLD